MSANRGPINPPPVQTPITADLQDWFGIPYDQRPEQPIVGSGINPNWAAWFSSVYTAMVVGRVRSRAYVGAGVAIPTNAWTAIAFGFNDYDSGDTMGIQSIHSTTTNITRFQIPPSGVSSAAGGPGLAIGGAGIYLLHGQVMWTASALGVTRGAGWIRNGATMMVNTFTGYQPLAGQLVAVQSTTLVSLNDGDYVEFIGYQDTGAPLVALAGQGYTYGSILRVF